MGADRGAGAPTLGAVALDVIERDAVALGLAASVRDAAARLEPAAERRWWRLVATETFDAWLIDWPEGTGVDRHDHDGAAASICVLRGELTETRYETDGSWVERTVGAGALLSVDSRASHEVANRAAAPATSVHVYSPPLRTMGFYDGAAEPQRRDLVDPTPALWTAELS